MTEIVDRVDDATWNLWEAQKLEAVEEERKEHTTRSKGTASLRLVDVADLLRNGPPRVDWVVKDVLARGAVTLLSGREKTGKSLYAAVLAAKVSDAQQKGRQEYAGSLKCFPGTVLYVDAENGPDEMSRRLHALGQPQYVTVAGSEGFDLGENLGELGSLTDELKPDVIVLDSFSSLWPSGDENDRAEVNKVLHPLHRFAREKHVAVLLLHHTTKEGSGYRGSTAIGATVQVLVNLRRWKESGVRVLTWEGSRLGQEPNPIRIRLSSGDSGVAITEL